MRVVRTTPSCFAKQRELSLQIFCRLTRQAWIFRFTATCPWAVAFDTRWHPLRAGAAGSGDLAWSVGHGNFHFNVGTANETRSPSKYITVWLNTPAGWKYLIDAGNARPADPAQ